jgi:predicted nucleotidyltransferase
MPRSSAQSAQRYPLTFILGSEANVRLLRELFRHGGQISAPQLAIRSGLAKASVWTALVSLEAMGIVRAAGTGRSRLYGIRSDHPLAAALDALFAAEEARFAAMRQAVRTAASACGPGVLAAWIYGSVARNADGPGSDVDIVVVAEPAERARIVDAVREALAAPAATLGFVPAVVGIDPGDVDRLSREHDPWWTGVAADAMVLLGDRPDDLVARVRRGKAVA